VKFQHFLFKAQCTVISSVSAVDMKCVLDSIVSLCHPAYTADRHFIFVII